MLLKTLDIRFDEMKVVLKQHLSNQKHLCATADVWTARAQSYLGVTIHFLNSLFKRESYVIGFKQLHGRHTYDILGKTIHEIMLDFGIRNGQLRNIVTDGGSNFAKMFKKYGEPLEVFNYVNDELSEDEQGEPDDYTEPVDSNENPILMTDANGELFINEILDFENTNADATAESTNDSSDETTDNYFDNTNLEDETNKINLPPQKRCMSHKCNLILGDFKNNLTGLAKTGLHTTQEKLNTLWVLTHRSSYAKTICKEVLGQCLPTPSDTRWNSEIDAIKFCNKPTIAPKLNTLIETLKQKLKCKSALSLQTLTKNDFTIIEQYIKVMEPVAHALDIMQKEYNSSQGLILPVLRSMKQHIEKIDEKLKIARDFKNAMLKAIDFRFKSYFSFNEQNNDLLLASVSLPRMKTNFIEKNEDIIYAKHILLAECKKLKSETVTEPAVESPKPNDDDDFIISYDGHRTERRNSVDNEIESEILRYLADPRKENSMLNEYPHVREIFFMYNTTISSSAPVERVFSQSLLIFTPRRNRISNVHFEQTLLLKHNRILLDENGIHSIPNNI